MSKTMSKTVLLRAEIAPRRTLSKRPPPPCGYRVYFVQTVKSRRTLANHVKRKVKIGFTGRGVDIRLRELELAWGKPLIPIGWMDVDVHPKRNERAVQRHFVESFIFKEMYRISIDEIADFEDAWGPGLLTWWE